jgi:hypothetical protein
MKDQCFTQLQWTPNTILYLPGGGEGGERRQEKEALTLRQIQIRHVNLSIAILTHRICFIISFIKRKSRSAPKAFDLDPRVNYRPLGSRNGVSGWACLV